MQELLDRIGIRYQVDDYINVSISKSWNYHSAKYLELLVAWTRQYQQAYGAQFQGLMGQGQNIQSGTSLMIQQQQAAQQHQYYQNMYNQSATQQWQNQLQGQFNIQKILQSDEEE